MPAMIGPTLPDSLIVDDNDTFAPAPQTGYWRGLQVAAEEGFAGSISGLINTGKAEFDQILNPGRILSEEDYKNSEYYRPDLKVDGPISENVARIRAQARDDSVIRQQQLAAMPRGILSSGTKLAGNLIGFAMNPINIAATGAAAFWAGKASTTVMAALEESATAAQVAARTAIGAAEGAAIVTPDTLIRYQTEKVLGENPSGLAALVTVGVGAALGGAIHGTFGSIKPITPDSYMKAKETAVNQMKDGKSVNVAPILKDGYRTQRMVENAKVEEGDVPRETIERENEDLRNQIAERQEKLAFFNEAKKTEDLNIVVKGREQLVAEEITAAEEEGRLARPEDITDYTRGNQLDDYRLQLSDEIDNLEKRIANNEAYIGTRAIAGEPVTHQELKNASLTQDSWKQDQEIDLNKDASFVSEAKAAEGSPEEHLQFLENDVNSLRDLGKLNEEDEAIVNDVKLNRDKFERFKDILEQAKNCLKGSD